MYHHAKIFVELRFLKTFLKYGAKWSNCNVYWRTDANEHVPLKFLLDNIDASVNEAVRDLQPFCEGTNGASLDMNCILSKLEERLEGFKSEIREAHIALSKYSLQFDSLILSDELLVELINSVADNLIDLAFCNDILPVKEHVKTLEKNLRFLRSFVRFTSKKRIEHDLLEDLLKHVEAVATGTANLCFMCWFSNTPTSMEELQLEFSKLIEKFKPVNPDIREIYIRVLVASRSSGLSGTLMDELVLGEFIDSLHENMLELLEYKSFFMVLLKDQITTLNQEFRFLKTFLMDQSKLAELHEKMSGVLKHIGDMVSEAGILIFSMFVNEMQEDEAKEMSLALLDLQRRISVITGDIKKNCLKLLTPDIPMSDDVGIIDILLADLEELGNCKIDSVASEKHKIETMKKDIVFLRSFLGEVSEQRNESEEMNALWTCIMNVAYQTKCVIDPFFKGDCPPLCFMLCDGIIKEIKFIKAEIIKIYYKKRYDQARKPAVDEVVVGFSDEAETIINLLIRGSTELDLVSIVGMPGLGKTSLARKVFNDDSIGYHFHVRAWCVVSQAYQRREMLLDILSDVSEYTDQIYEMSVDDLEEKLYKLLKGKRYLIVLDDIWNIGAWDDLNRLFPNDRNGSRIMLTSRLHDVALHTKHISDPHPLRLLSDNESWDLLQKRLYDKENFPEELEEVGKRIAKNCKGLPLAVVVIAGLLAKTDKKQDSWEEIANSLSSQVVSDPKQCMEVLQLSYKHLPDHLKTCFLYFGVFREDQEIPVWKLKWLWIAEGFVEKSELRSLEDLAEDYLTDLIGRSLVMVSKRQSRGGVKACHIHDLLHNLCVTKAKEENFLQLIHEHDKILGSPIPYKRGRLCIYSKWRYFIKSKPSGPRVQSLLLFATGQSYQDVPRDVSFISYNFKRLQVLDLGSINAGDLFPDGIQWLVQLRYLAVRGRMNSIPSSIANLWNLETFLVSGLRGEIVLPSTIWKMMKLRHLHVNDLTSFSLHNYNVGKSSQLGQLRTVSTLSLSYGQETDMIMRKLPNIQELKCLFLEVWDESNNCYQFPALDFLSQLVSLNVFSAGKIQFPCELNFPSNLKKLTLSKFCLPWSEISRIARLPHLEVLKLLFRAFEGEQWEMRDEEFLQLRYLKLDNLNITQWNASSSDHFPLLEQLVLQRCSQLEEIPTCLGHIPTLEMIEVRWCNNSIASSVREIQDEQIDLGNEGLKVLIYPADLENRSSS